jgi:peptide deformylase
MIRQILIWPDKMLTQEADEVTVFDDDLKQLADDMIETMVAANGKGLAAPQMGVLKNIIVVDLNSIPTVLVNPSYSSETGEMQNLQEGCLSVPGVFERFDRLDEIRVVAQDVSGADILPMLLKGYDARAVLHELDHLNGIVFVDYLSSLKRDIIRKKMLKLKR